MDLQPVQDIGTEAERLAGIAEDLLTEDKAIKYYDKVREALIEAGTWEKRRSAILQKIKDGAHPVSVARFAKKHGETDLLLEAVQEQPGLLGEFLDDLVPKYVSEAAKIVTDEARYAVETGRSGPLFAGAASRIVYLA